MGSQVRALWELRIRGKTGHLEGLPPHRSQSQPLLLPEGHACPVLDHPPSPAQPAPLTSLGQLTWPFALTSFFHASSSWGLRVGRPGRV